MNLVGEHVGNYVVTRELGAGGMGTVYLAEHPTLGRKVAIKVLHDDHAMDPDTVARFFQEARAAADIGEEHIVEVIDFGELTVRGSKVVYLMMELLEGMSLGKRLQQGPMPVDEVAQVATQVCVALGASHAKGIIHRDLKPENIYLCPRVSNPLFTKVLDFGIAKLTGPTKASARTRAGTLLGTPAYMSPEQCLAARDIDARVDIYALGVVLFEMLTGQLPFAGNLGQLLEGHLQHAPDPPSRRNPAITPQWDAIVLHCLEKARDDRVPSMEALAAAIRDPAAHLIAYQQQLAARVTRPQAPRSTVVLPVEVRPELAAPTPSSPGSVMPSPRVNAPEHGAAADGAAAAPWGAPTPPPQFVPMPPAVAAELGRAPTLSVTPTPAPFTSPVPFGTPGPFSVAALPQPIPAPAPVPTHSEPPPLRGASVRVWLGAALVSGVVAVVVLGIATLVRGGSDEGPRIDETTHVMTPGTSVPAPAPVASSPAPAPVASSPAPAPVASPPVDAPVASPEIVDAAQASVRLTITSSPKGALVKVRRRDTLDECVSPCVVELPPGTEPATITLTAPGYASVTRTLVPRVDAEVVVVLQRTSSDKPRRRTQRTTDDLIRPE